MFGEGKKIHFENDVNDALRNEERIKIIVRKEETQPRSNWHPIHFERELCVPSNLDYFHKN